MVQVQLMIKKVLWKNDLVFPVVMWLASRMFIWTAMLLVAPLLPTSPERIAPTFGWGVFDAWDTIHYRAIATSGYEFVNDGKGHNIAFFPLFPLLIRGLMNLGLSFEVAGILINNLAFLLTLYFLYFWAKKFYGSSAARWSTTVLAWCPLSLFTTVIYTEGLYLLLSTAALQAFDQQQYRWTAFWGAMATATRPTGIALIPALAIAAWKQRRPPIAYIAGLSTAIGILLFSLYCAINFGDPLAFITAQKGWRPSLGFDWQGWWKMLMQITVGTTNWKYGSIKDPLPPLLFGVIVVGAYMLWRYRQKLGAIKVDYGFAVLILLWWILGGDPLINMAAVLGGAYLLWHLRTELTPVTLIYGCCGLGLIFASGGTWSLSRLAYGIVSLSVALGVLLSRHPRWGYLTLFFFMILLATFSIRFAQDLWVG
ncbi:glycosyltransferase family 39 protein [Nostocaceae cyanobacterium CENA357]|uniref:Glycosyltransferase family 39 protein n=1 Tax=Atlanticothrix silvestris CENA357 TaxID=1725252 RepID=A0A8J7HB07_9CYAN|nr:mannosyltransferase family protein [Atlanticothrix silvestris]MBH8553103.1 glycosyltransferase family 39 protein [Atlanticothrix silvestris CENA357]